MNKCFYGIALGAACLIAGGCASTDPSTTDGQGQPTPAEASLSQFERQLLEGAELVATGKRIQYSVPDFGVFFLVDARTGRIIQTETGDSFESRAQFSGNSTNRVGAMPSYFEPVLYYKRLGGSDGSSGSVESTGPGDGGESGGLGEADGS